MADLKRVTLHLLVADPHGPIPSSTPKLPGMKAGVKSRWRFACDVGKVKVQGGLDRGTLMPWGVSCAACRATTEFKARPPERPSRRGKLASGALAAHRRAKGMHP